VSGVTTFLSSDPEICFPALPGGRSVGLLAILFQLEQSQWWSPDEMAHHQFRQLARVVEHARRTVPFYRERFESPELAASLVNPRSWREVPLLSRRDIQLRGDDLHSRQVPPSHGRVSRTTTSGSTNAPVATLGTQVTELFWRALTLRDHVWHRRDFSQSLAAIRYVHDARAAPPEGARDENWGPATAGVVQTGPVYLLDVRASIAEQTDWLVRVNPGYIVGYPSALLGVARMLDQQGRRLSQLRELRTFGEIVESECRGECERTFGVPLVDMYSSQEVGYIALQCPEHDHYHAQSENLLVEVIDDDGRPCSSGQVGRVVVTTLHNFAMPLVRYDIGDYAEVGPPCPCGRGLPVLTRILGRQRNLLRLPDGSRRWPVFDAGERPEELPAFFQYQVIQRGLEELEVLAVRPHPFTAAEEARVQTYMQQTLGYPFRVVLRRVDAIARSRTGKFEDFICELP
jgi:phenylacetate-CoA ligase